MFVDMNEDLNTKPKPAPFHQVGVVSDLKKAGITIEYTVRTVRCTELSSKKPFKIVWKNNTETKESVADKFSDDNWRIIFADVMNDSDPLYFNVEYLEQ